MPPLSKAAVQAFLKARGHKQKDLDKHDWARPKLAILALHGVGEDHYRAIGGKVD